MTTDIWRQTGRQWFKDIGNRQVSSQRERRETYLIQIKQLITKGFPIQHPAPCFPNHMMRPWVLLIIICLDDKFTPRKRIRETFTHLANPKPPFTSSFHFLNGYLHSCRHYLDERLPIIDIETPSPRSFDATMNSKSFFFSALVVIAD